MAGASAGAIPISNGTGPRPSIASSPTAATDSTAPVQVADEALFRALIARTGAKAPARIKLTDSERETLVDYVIQEFQDADAGARQYKENLREMVANWRGVTDEKDYPFEGAANVRVPFTSVHVEQMKARLLKALFGGELWSKLQYIERQLQQEELAEANTWWNWELRKVVKFKDALRDVIHDLLVVGTSIPIPSYHHETRFLHSFKQWQFDDSQPLSLLLQQGLEQILDEPSSWGVPLKYEIKDQPQPGIFNLSAIEQAKKYDAGKIVFSLDPDQLKLRADIWKREVVFDGARVNYVSIEDLVVVNTDPDLEKLPFFGVRCWYSINDYREGLEDGFFIDYGKERNAEIIAAADIKQGDIIGRQISDLQDAEEGTDSSDSASNAPRHKFLECYRWEGWWVWGTDETSAAGADLLKPATQICAWVEPKSKALLKIERLEDLNKDGKRSGVKFGFIREPGRFYEMGQAEWIHHTQNILDAINNQRLDAGLLFNVPFGFYKPTAGFKGTIRIEPGVFHPSSDPNAVNMPRSNWQPTFSIQEELLQRQSGDMQAGLSNTSLGHAPSKRQSATEVASLASAIDLRTEDIVERLLEAQQELATRIFGLYQQFGPEERMFRVGGEGGIQVTRHLARDRLQGKIELEMCGNLAQINEQMQREIAMEMLSLLMNAILIQMGIVQPDTIHEAIALIAKLSHYEVPLHKPQTPPQSEAPEVEEQQMFAGHQPLGPTATENFGEHLQHHSLVAADMQLMESWTPQARQLLGEHIRASMQMAEAVTMMKQQQAALAVQMRRSMEQLGVNPGGPGGQRSGGQNTGPGTQSEGVQGAGMTPSAPVPAPGQGG